MVIDHKYAIPGTVSLDQLLAAMTQAWTDIHPVLQVVGGTEGTCGPDSCAV